MHFRSERLLAFSKAYSIFRSELYKDNEKDVPILSELHKAFALKNAGAHNCLGCNFSELTNSFDQILRDLCHCTEVNAPCITYLFWLYLYIERYDQIMDYLRVPEGYKHRHFSSFQLIRRWANFIKHPKSFLFVHHPQCLHGGEVGDEGLIIEDDTVQITSDFINEFYAGGDKNNKLAKKLNNAEKVIVVYPDPENLMKRFAKETKSFVRLINNNEVYREELSKITTAPKYFLEVHPNEVQKV